MCARLLEKGNRKVIIIGAEPSMALSEIAYRHATASASIPLVTAKKIGYDKDFDSSNLTGDISELLSFRCKEVEHQLTLIKEDSLNEPFHYVTRRERRANERKDKKKSR